MGGGDLNMKKSWHPLLIKNQERVWKEEQKALEEQKKLNQLKKEKEEERQLQELRQIQESAGGRKGQERLDWMYAAGPNQSSSAKAQELEDFLLGKKRVDSLIEQGTSMDKLSADSKEVFSSISSISNPNANNYRDTQSKIREDPLFLIKKTEQANIKSIVSNPLKLKEIQEKLEKKKDKKKKKKSKRRDEDSSLSDHKEKSRKDHKKRSLVVSEDESPMKLREHDRNDRTLKRSRLRSLSRSRSRSRERYDRHRYESKYSNSTKEDRYSNRDRDSRKERYEPRHSNRDHDTYEDRDRGGDLREGRNDSRRRYNHHGFSPRRSRSLSPPGRREPYNRNDRRDNYNSHNSRDHKERKEHNGRSETDKIKAKEEAERKLIEMMEDAKKLTEERKKRVEQTTKEEEEEERKLAEDKRSRENGTQSDFLKNAYKLAYSSHSSIGLGERLQRHRGTSQKISVED